MSDHDRIPLAQPLAEEDSASDFAEDAPASIGRLTTGPLSPGSLTPIKICTLNLKQGCYKIKFTPKSTFILKPIYYGTLRVELSGSSRIISGDLYKFSRFLLDPVIISRPVVSHLDQFDEDDTDGIASSFDGTSDGEAIPVYARRNYYSYLKGTSYSKSLIGTSTSPCKITIEAEEWVYNQPSSTSSFNGSFNSSYTRKVKMILKAGSTSKQFIGEMYAGSTLLGTISLTWVSNYFRRATAEIDTLTGAVSPQPLNPGTSSEESFATIFATCGWKMTPIYNDTNIAVPSGITATNCWTDASLHALMLAVRSTAVTLDAEWRFHMLVVPGQMGCSRGKMYDQIGAHREACVSYSDDGYPTSDSLNFGTAANKKQRNVPRAFIRSAAHELGHCCNMMHQESEGGADNSIMTTTPSVANVLGSATTGAPGVFPTNINLGFNAHCRHHLIHFPDPVVRPGAMNWTAGHTSFGGAFAPSADGGRVYFDETLLSLTIKQQDNRIKLGEPLLIAWELENLSKEPIPVPSDISTNLEFTSISVTDPDGNVRDMPGFIVECEHASIKPLEPGKKIAAATQLFWSSNGFAFSKPGKHSVDMTIRWTFNNIPYGVHQSIDIWVDYPAQDTDNELAATMLNDEVGMFVALGGNAYHLQEATARIQKAIKIDPKHAVTKAFSKMYSATSAKAYKPIKLERKKK